MPIPAPSPRRAPRLVAGALAAVAGAVAVGCLAPRLPPVDAGTVARAQARWPGVDAAELRRGRTLVVGKCGGCHAPPAVTARTAAGWPAALDEMSARSHLTGDERAAIERYLTAAAPR